MSRNYFTNGRIKMISYVGKSLYFQMSASLFLLIHHSFIILVSNLKIVKFDLSFTPLLLGTMTDRLFVCCPLPFVKVINYVKVVELQLVSLYCINSQLAAADIHHN